MSKTTKSDWAASVPWTGVTGAPSVFPSGPIDISSLTAAGFAAGKVPSWNGSRFVPVSLPVIPTPTPSGTTILPLDSPGVATRKQPAGSPFGPTQDVWFRGQIHDIRLYGAYGYGSADVTTAVNRAIDAINSAGGGGLYAPSGYYRLDSTPTELTVPCSVFGDGPGATKFNFGQSGFSGGSGGDWFEVSNMAMVSDGTAASTAISVTDGTSAGDDGMFSFHDLDIYGFATGIYATAAARKGFFFDSRIQARTYGLNVNCAGGIYSNLFLNNLGSTSAVGILLSGSNHRLHGLRIFSSGSRWANGIVVNTGAGGAIADSYIGNCLGAAVSLTDGSSAADSALHWRVENVQFEDVQGANPVVFNPSKHYVNELQGLGSSTNTSFDQRRELTTSSVWNPPSIRPMESATEEFSLLGAQPGDQIIVGAPYEVDFLQVSAKVRTNDTVRITITNQSGQTVDPASGTWKIRLLN